MVSCSDEKESPVIKYKQSGAYMIFFAILLKAVLWVLAFRSAVKAEAFGMLARAAGIAIVLTVIDRFSVGVSVT